MNKEIKLHPRKKIVTKTNFKGNIVYANDEFSNMSGYTKKEFIFKSHNIIRHQDMPKTIFKLMWKSLRAKSNFLAIIKNKTKCGNFYWVTTDFDIELDHSNLPDYYTATRRAVPKYAKKEIEKLYSNILNIEETQSLEDASIYLNSFLEDKGYSFCEYIDSILKKKSFFEKVKGF